MSRRSTLGALLTNRPAQRVESEPSSAVSADTPRPVTPPVSADTAAPAARPRSGAMRAMESALSGLAAQVELGSAIIDLDPALLDGSFVADRVADATDPTFAGLVESMRTSGQQVPVLARRHPEREGRYQIAYGHRRVRAAAILGMPVRAVVRALTDAELVVAQGKENLERRDLSYIERAYFARRLEDHGFPRDVIGAALGEHRPNLVVLIAVARAVPDALVAAIGPAPKAGRGRWQLLAERIRAGEFDRALAVTAAPDFGAKPTDERFAAVFDGLAPKVAPKPRSRIWQDEHGRKIARIERGAGRFVLSIDEELEPGLGDAVVERLPEILAFLKAGKA